MNFLRKKAKKKRIVWVERLGILDVIIFLFQQVFSNIIVHYDEFKISNSCKLLLTIFKKLKKYQFFIPANLSLNTKDSHGYAMYYQLESNLNICVEEFCRSYIPKEPDRFRKILKCYLAGLLFQGITFITMVESKIATLYKENHEIFIVRKPGNFLLIRFYKSKGLEIKQSFGFGECLKIIIRPFVKIAVMIFSQFIQGTKVKTNIKNIRPSVWVEYTMEEASDRRMNRWSDYVKDNRFDMVYYMDRIDSPVSKEAIKTCKENKFKWIDVLKLYKIKRLSCKEYSEILGQLLRLNLRQPLWFHCYKLQFSFYFKLFHSIYKHFQVKILIQHQNSSWIQGVQAIAIESVGGIMLGFEWSSYIYDLQPTHLTPQHISFFWGKISYLLSQNKGLMSRYVLPSGISILSTKYSSNQFQEFFNKFNLTISIFDSSVTYDIYQTPETLDKFYMTILKMLEENPEWGVIIKSKNWNSDGLSFLPNGKTIISKIKSLIEKKKLLFCDKWLSPLKVAAHVDINVCYSINSAGIIVGMEGYRAIHWDCSGWLKYPIYNDPDQQIVYLSLEEIKQAIVKVSKGDKSIGDFAAWKQKFNYFDDFKGPERIGKFIQNFMDEVIRTGNASHSLDLTVQKYLKENQISEDWTI